LTREQICAREELDRIGDTNAPDVLRRLPGVNVGSGGPRKRGLGAGYTQILINANPAPQGFNLDQLSPSQIERIEVPRAPTAEQGTHAVAGKINIILKEAPCSCARWVGAMTMASRRRALGRLVRP
jgi:outer membrane receptor for ferrienterochelin and colicins